MTQNYYPITLPGTCSFVDVSLFGKSCVFSHPAKVEYFLKKGQGKFVNIFTARSNNFTKAHHPRFDI